MSNEELNLLSPLPICCWDRDLRFFHFCFTRTKDELGRNVILSISSGSLPYRLWGLMIRKFRPLGEEIYSTLRSTVPLISSASIFWTNFLTFLLDIIREPTSTLSVERLEKFERLQRAKFLQLTTLSLYAHLHVNFPISLLFNASSARSPFRFLSAGAEPWHTIWSLLLVVLVWSTTESHSPWCFSFFYLKKR